jgi:hypothetical protein
MQRISLDDIRREATELEIDLCIADGYVDLSKRGDASLFYRSVHLIDDPRVLPDAWEWLQLYRTNVQHLDEARAQLAHQSTDGQVVLAQPRTSLANPRVASAFVWQVPVTQDPLCIIQCSSALTVGGIIGVLSDNCFLGVGICLALLIGILGVRHRRFRRRAKQVQNQRHSL